MGLVSLGVVLAEGDVDCLAEHPAHGFVAIFVKVHVRLLATAKGTLKSEDIG